MSAPTKSCIVALALLASLAVPAHGQARSPAQPGKNDCPASAPYLDAEALKAAGFELPVFKRLCFSDRSGSHVLVLGEAQDAPFAEELLSKTLQAALYKVEGGRSLSKQWSIRDFASKDEAGVNFRSKLIELTDLDGDGLVDPVLVYRFFDRKDATHFESDDFAGRIKIVAFHRGRKAAIHAITGQLDGERTTTANGNYFALPKPVQQHLVRKMAAMYEAGQFGFDNSYGFVPRKESAAR